MFTSGYSCRRALVAHSGILEMVNPPARQRLNDANRVQMERLDQSYDLSGAPYDLAVAERERAFAHREQETINRRLRWVLLGQHGSMTAHQLNDWFDEHHPGLRADGESTARVLRALGESRLTGCREIAKLMRMALYFSGVTRSIDELWGDHNIVFDLAMDIERGA